ncbi:mannose-1-phosphate guanylyltransferase/mannose-6-phosphate isomerase [Gilvimarinus chinensis]|uniref:mannose-1-phosphate guanylyltransferase/mannose-6-phosphate isomerase n=1 Tax=Gilvimarinus chinensis TaxID=396005 RepID=UPI000368A43A|nr:mannose-1-phosphate guanylyltransferase/mannose-6-phosphate isomerase [Gilvimarinus chinensis]
MIIPVLLAGGSGNRLWPLSRELCPKQCIKLTNSDFTLIQDTLLRVSRSGFTEKPIIVCNNEHRFLVAQQIEELALDADIILEPAARNTAPAVALSAFEALSRSADAQILVLPADHLINEQQSFAKTVTFAHQSMNSRLLAFGVVPRYPETGYGYIEAQTYGELSAISAFHEKPALKQAQDYLQAGNYYWNSGMYLFPAQLFLQELKAFEPALYDAVAESYHSKYTDLDFIRAGEEAFKRAESVSVDVAVMERTKAGMVMPYSGDWSDVGSWDSVHQTQPQDDNGNVCVGDVLLEATKNSYINSAGRLIATVGVNNLAIVDTADALLVMDRNSSQDVKKIVQQLKDLHRTEHRLPQNSYRVWGSVETVNLGKHYQIKHVMIKPGGEIALQVHKYRSEHWVIVSGTAEVSLAGELHTFTENDSVHIRSGDVHSIKNIGTSVLEIIEVQTGTRIDEEDIVRFTNNYLPGDDR